MQTVCRKIVQKPEINAQIEAQVAKAVFADAERKEREAAAAAEAARLQAEAEAAAEAARAALPGLLRQAAKDGHVEDYADDDGNLQRGMQSILAEGIEIDGVDDQGYTALVRRQTGPPGCGHSLRFSSELARAVQYCATMYNKENAVGWCIANGAAVDQENNNGVTPLMAAARDGYTAIVLQLLEAGADFAQVDEFGRTADSVAEEKGFPETAAAVKEFAAAHAG